MFSIIQAFLEKRNTSNENKGMCYIPTPPLVGFCAKTSPYSLWAPNLRLFWIYPQTQITFNIALFYPQTYISFAKFIILPPDAKFWSNILFYPQTDMPFAKAIFYITPLYLSLNAFFYPQTYILGQIHYFTPRPIYLSLIAICLPPIAYFSLNV